METTYIEQLERIRAERAEMRESMAALTAALEVPVGLGAIWRRRVRAALTELAHDLQDHVGITEGEQGLYAELVTADPRLALAVDAQLADHQRLTEHVEALLAERDEGLESPEAVRAHRESATALIGAIVRHHQRGSDLVYQAYEVDLGGSG